MAKLSIKNVYKHFSKEVTAVSDFCLEIEDKEFIVFVGPSGCGKSTTLRMIAGLEDISSGEVFIDEKLINDVPPKDRDIAMVFQNYALYPHMTVFENMAFALTLRKTPKEEIKKKVLEAAEILDIVCLLDRKPKELSGGQRQRVALGRAIVRHPKVFLMDEPLSNLDAKMRVQMRAEISKLHQKMQTTFIYVTHDQVEAMTMGTRIVAMKDGFIQQVDTPKALYEKPCSKWVAGFIGSPQMNFIDAAVEKLENRIYVSFGTYRIYLPEKKAKTLENEGYIGKIVTIGIRPEAIFEIQLHGNDSGLNLRDLISDKIKSDFDSRCEIEGTVEVLEMLGAEILLHLNCDGIRFVAKVSERSKAKVGETIKVLFDPEMIHIFDIDTEKTITN